MQRLLLSIMMLIFMCSGADAYETGTQVKILIDSASYIAVDNRADVAAVVSSKNQMLSIIDTKSTAIVNQVPLAAPPSGLIIRDGKIIVSAVSGQIWLFKETGEISEMINTDTEIVSLAAGDLQSVVIASKDMVRTVDISKGEIKELLKIEGKNPKLYSSEKNIYITDENNGNTELFVVEKATGKIQTIEIAGNVTGIGFDEQLGYLLATMSGKTSLFLYDINTLLSVGEIETNSLIANLSVNQSTHMATMASLADGNLLIVGLESKLVEKTYPLFESITETAIDQSRNVALVALNQNVMLVKLENPVPVLDSLSPDNILAGSDGFMLSLLGKKFLKDTQAWFNQKPLNTLFDTNQLLKSDILPDELIYPGTVTVSASNPTPGGGVSNPLVFKIITPIPQIAGVSPDAVEVNSPTVIRVEGKNFLPTAKVMVDGAKVETYFVSSIVLRAKFSSDAVGAEGTRKISVVNTGQTAAVSNVVDLKVASTDEMAKINAAQSAAVATAETTLLKGSLRGKILNTKKEPVANVTVSYKNLSVKTGTDGTFVLNDIPQGRRTLLLDGSTAFDTKAYYPAIPVTADITANTVTQLSFTPHLHHQKNHNFVKISQGQDTVVTDPDMPGFEMQIKKDNRIVGWDGKVNDKVSIRTVPPDRLPIRPLPDNSHVRSVTMFFFDKVGGGRPDQPVPFKSPNTLRLKPGEKATLWYYDESSADGEAPNDWAIAGSGTVSDDGRYIVTDAGVGIPKFCCGATAWGGMPPDVSLPAPNGSCLATSLGGCSNPGPEYPEPIPSTVSDPVDVSSGFFVYDKTDMVVAGIIPIKIKRYYVSRLSGSAVSSTGSDGLGIFGKGMSFEYDWRVDDYLSMLRLTKPGGSTFDFSVIETGTYWKNTTNPEFISAAFTRDGSGRKILTTRDGWKYVFAVAGGLETLTDRNGNTVTITRGYNLYDASGYITKITNAEGKDIVFHQSADLQYYVITNSIVGPDGRAVNYSYEPDPFSVFPRLKKVTEPDGMNIQYGYDTQGRMNTITDGNGVVKLTNVYDVNQRVISQTGSDGAVTTFNYTTAGGTITQTDVTAPNGSVTSWRFNPYSYGSDYTTSDGVSTQNMNFENLIIAATDPLNRTTWYNYGMNKMVKSITDPLNNVTSYEYEGVFGLPTKITNALGKSTTIEYTYANITNDNHSAITKAVITDPLLHTTTVNYNNYAMPASVTDANGNTSTMNYDIFKPYQLISVSDALANTTNYTYDVSGRVATVTDAKGAKSSFQYDNADRIISSTDARGNATIYAYDNNGNLKTLTDVKGNTTTYQYDNKNRLIKTTDRLGKFETYSYYTGSEITATTGTNLKSYTDKRGQVTAFNSYDAMDRMTKVTFADGSTIQYTYDAVGRPTAITDTLSGTIAYTYDTLDRVIQETTPFGAITYAYDVLGRRTSMTVAGEPIVNYAYDNANRTTTVSKIVGGILRNYALGYDNGGRRSSLQIPLLATGTNINTTYGFDAVDRLQGLTHQGPVGTLEAISYISDANGNRTSMGRSVSIPQAIAISGTSYDNEYEMLSYNGNTLAYDENGNLTTKTDANGNVTTYTWDARNRLVAINAPTMATPLSAAFQYDALNRRITKTVNGVTTTYVYDSMDIIQETTNGLKTNHVRTLGVDEPLSKAVDGGTVNHYVKDGLGSVIKLVDDNGNSVSSLAYDAYGNTSSTESFGFTGRENDGTGLMYYRARYYSPEMGRFISRDPLGIWSNKYNNQYMYVENNPVNFTDPTGLFRFGITDLGPRNTGLKFLNPFNFSNDNLLPSHTQGFYGNGSNIGFYPTGLMNNQNIANYTISMFRYDDNIMRQAEMNVIATGAWDGTSYRLTSHNCQDFANTLRTEYFRLGGERHFDPFGGL